MGLSSALNIVVSGLQFNQKQTQVVAGNISNAGTPGYTRKVITATETQNGSGNVNGVRASAVQRQLDLEVQRLVRDNLPGASFANLTADITARLDALYGAPGDPSSLDALFNSFTESLQGLSTSPEDFSLRSTTLSDAQVLAQRINAVSDGIQNIRTEQETNIGTTVERINELLGQIDDFNQQAVLLANTDGAGPGALDHRDRAVAELASLIDIKVTERADSSITIQTTSGYTLFDVRPATLSFDGSGAAYPGSLYNADPALRGVGTVSIGTLGGSTIDLIAQNGIGSGLLAAQINARDDILVEAQKQIDTLAEALSLALSNEAVSGTAVNAAGSDGFDLDLTGLQAGNVATLEFTTSGTPTTLSFVRVNETATLPLDDSVTANPDDTVVGLDFSGGFAAVITQIQAALGGAFTVSDEGGNVVRILDDGVAATIDIQSFDASVTNTALTDQGIGVPFFVDGVTNRIYTGEVDNQSQITGFASRIQVNQSLKDNPDALVVYQTTPTTTAGGDSARPSALYDRLVNAQRDFGSGVGFSSVANPYHGSISGFLTQTISHRANEADIAAKFADGQNVVLNNLQERLVESSEVSIDQELSILIEIQNAYAANARVVQVIDEMLDALLRV